jgi:transcriptional regulator with XRE-family HTH domain
MVARLHTLTEFGAALRQARLDAGLTQAELAARARVSRRWLGLLENGGRPGAELSKALAVVSALNLALSLEPAGEPTGVEAEILAILDSRTKH